MLKPESQARIDGVVIGIVAGFSSVGEILVAFGNNPQDLPIAAKAATAVSSGDVGKQVAILFENGSTDSPVIIGLIQSLQNNRKNLPGTLDTGRSETVEEAREAIVDGRRVVLQAEESIELKCGKSSITLTRAGKIIVRGEYLSSKSTGVNRIHGGSVQIN